MDGTQSNGSTFRNILPVALILVPLVIHFVLVGCTLIGSWFPLAFLFSHLVFFAVGLWTLHDRKSFLPVVMFIIVLVATALLDIIQLGLYFDNDLGSSISFRERIYQFSAGMCIINLVLKVVTGVLAGVTLFLRKSQTGEQCPCVAYQSNYKPEVPQTKPVPTTAPGYAARPVPTTTPGYATRPVPTTAPGYGTRPVPTTAPGYGTTPEYTTTPGYGTEPGYSAWPTSDSQYVNTGDHPAPAYDERHVSH